MAEEENRLKALLKVAEDETASLESRKNAVNALNQIIPGYNAQLDETTGKYTANADALTRYNEALKKKYELEGAKDLLAELSGEKARLNIEKAELEADIARLNEQQQNIESGGNSMNTQAYGTAGMTMSQYSGASTAPLLALKQEDLEDINEELDAIAEKEAIIFGAYGEDLSNSFAEEIKNNSNNNGGGGSGGRTAEEPKAWREREDAINRTAYATGQIDYEAFLKKKHEILIEYYNQMLQDTSLSENERLVLLAEKAEAEQDWQEKQNDAKEKRNAEALKRSLEEIDRKYEQTKAHETAWCYDITNENYGNEKILHEKLFQANVEYLKEKEQLYREQGKNDEADKVLLERETLVNNEKLRKHKEFLASYRRLQNEYLHITNEEKKQAELTTLDALHAEGIIKEIEYQELKLKIEEKYSSNKEADNFKKRYLTTEERQEEELKLLERLYTEGAIKEEEYQQLKLKIKEKYSKNEEKNKFSDNGFGDMLANLYTGWNELINGSTDNTLSNMEKIANAAQATWAIAGAALEQYSAYTQACCDAEIADIEAKYDKEIAAAGKNQKKVAQLEEQKEKDIAKVKGKYNKQAMKIEIAQAVAQTAMAAINAYASAAAVPVVGYILAPIAAAMAVAAGAMQIATIKKQHQAQQAGYYQGGFTRKSADDREEVGVVHANEFVANAQATRNPALSPFFSLVDYAQRNNTVGSLTANDVSHALGTGAVVKATSTTASESVQNSGELLAVAGSISSNTKVVQKLSERLDEGIEAFMVMDGERGFDKKYSDYNRLKNNPKR